MTRRMTWTAGAALLGAVLVLFLAGRGFGTDREDFVEEANDLCGGTAEDIAGIDPPTEPAEAIGYAIQVIEEKDRMVLRLRETSLPGDDADTLRSRWLDPAQRDLEAFLPRLTEIRDASLRGDERAVAQGLAALRAAGSDGVDVEMLDEYGLDDCVALYTRDHL